MCINYGSQNRPKLYVNGRVLDTVESWKDLGSVIDSKLAFVDHCALGAKRGNAAANFIVRTFIY